MTAGINANDAIVGYFYDQNTAGHGFIRTADGTITQIDAPWAGKNQYQGTFPIAINASGTITGMYYDDVGDAHGFVRTSDAAFVSFDGDEAHKPCYNMSVTAINDKGEIGGFCTNATDFIRTPAGRIVTFSLPVPDSYPVLRSLNAKGDATGYYVLSDSSAHGFIRTADGAFTSFDAPGFQTVPYGLNARDFIVGEYRQTSHSRRDGGFLRNADGSIEDIKPPGGNYGAAVTCINREGVIAGYFGIRTEGKETAYGFIRAH